MMVTAKELAALEAETQAREVAEAQSYKLLLHTLCEHLGDIASTLGDLNFNVEQLTVRFQEVTGSYSTLGDDEKHYIRTLDVGD